MNVHACKHVRMNAYYFNAILVNALHQKNRAATEKEKQIDKKIDMYTKVCI